MIDSLIYVEEMLTYCKQFVSLAHEEHIHLRSAVRITCVILVFMVIIFVYLTYKTNKKINSIRKLTVSKHKTDCMEKDATKVMNKKDNLSSISSYIPFPGEPLFSYV